MTEQLWECDGCLFRGTEEEVNKHLEELNKDWNYGDGPGELHGTGMWGVEE